ncbi:MAG: ATP-binding protein [Propionibacteriaceae bacterium]|jgi:predicted AAA+ superfamily ATPase|nr:ATP-binding protein [Propionibacteriaceae bacterium]
MDRDGYARLREWKNKAERKPLIVSGARQVGKTWLMDDFARKEYAQTVRLSLNEDEELGRIIFPDRSAHNIVRRLEIHTGSPLDPASTLIVFDEIQEVPNALASLKSFAETAPEYHVMAAGSLLGLAVHEGASFPVGKVEFTDLYPLTFSEFLRAVGQGSLDDLLRNGSLQDRQAFHPRLLEWLSMYDIVGGMPEAVTKFVATGSPHTARVVQEEILRAYDLDVSKHAPLELVPRIRKVFSSIAVQLGQEKKRFVYSHIEPGARARSYEMAIQWLIDAGVVYQVNRVSTPHVPLKAYTDTAAFKLYMLDVGLLGALAGLTPKTVLDADSLYTEFRGSLAEQHVLQELVAAVGVRPFYWTNDRNAAEVDFLLDLDNTIVPVEVKSAANLRARSLHAFMERFSPEHVVRASLTLPGAPGPITELPLYDTAQLRKRLTEQPSLS